MIFPRQWRLLPVIAVCFLGSGCCQNCADKPPPKETTSASKKIEGGDDSCCGCEIDRAKLASAAALIKKGMEEIPPCCRDDGGDPKFPAGWPLFGGTLRRNMVNLVDKDVPTDWSVEDDKFKNIKWAVKLGSKSYGGPVVSGGKVYVGTNNRDPRDPKKKDTKDKKHAVLMCFNEADGKFLWQNLHVVPGEQRFHEVTSLGLLSTPVVDQGKIYYVTSAGEVICADADTGKILWQFDMMAKLDVKPYHCSNCSPLVAGDKLFLVTGNGVDEEGKIESPKAPSFLALDKNKGTVAWQSNLPGEKIIEGQWSNPVYAVVDGKAQIIFPGGDSVLYSFEPNTGELIWKFNADPARPVAGPGEKLITNYMIGTPVVHDKKLYVGLGVYHEHPMPAVRHSYFLCMDITKKGDVSPVDLDAKNPKNKNSALVWAFGGEVKPKPALGKGRPIYFGWTISTPAVHDGLVWISENAGYLHCLDAKAGERYWERDFLSSFWGSPYWVDGKIYIGTEEGEIFIFAHGKEKKEDPKKPGNQVEIAKISMEGHVQGTPVVVNGVLYVMTSQRLYAIAKGGTAKEPQ